MSAQQIHAYIERLSNLLRNEFRRSGSEHGLQPIQIEALHYLSLCNRYSDTPMGVTEYLGQTKGTVSQSLKVLEKKGFLSKNADDNDKRIIHLKITEAGRTFLEEIIPAALFSRACEHLAADDQARIIDALKDLLRGIQRANAMKSFGVCRTCRYNQKLEAGGYLCGLTQEPLSLSDIQLICREHEPINITLGQ
ncbi:MAG: MarR family winged helix-turn-helix transcriptional regulator [Candidatus Thiodiazotropha sp. (ex Dulcina madagascariensis)]|nr:MarR family winged helix-turn-helix transcriptional regulator [Candidatus Thiodiazotropha sp. (ex Dulcina madagascariensis)]MCU7928784.1 MarR family winged helix-turn-helix transcriptional regulator [Candidatus Thiodiazotropha sp. (ex Dulcina madagascariensis)]